MCDGYDSSRATGSNRVNKRRFRQVATIRGVKFNMEDWTPENSAARLRALAVHLRKTQAELAALLGVSLATVCRWSNGHHVPDHRSRRAIMEIVEGGKK